jgi:hypothetical protein
VFENGTFVLYFVDGGRGDTDMSLNGTISCYGGAAVSERKTVFAIPTVTAGTESEIWVFNRSDRPTTINLDAYSANDIQVAEANTVIPAHAWSWKLRSW